MCHNVIVLFVFRQAGHQDLADRLVEVQYELTDRLAFYLCGRKPGESVLSWWELMFSYPAVYANEVILLHAFTLVRSGDGL